MPTDRRTLVSQALETALGGVAGVTTLSRNPAIPLGSADLPALLLIDGGMRVRQPGADGVYGEDGYVMTVDVEIGVSGATAEAAADALSDLWAKVVAALAADRSLGGLSQDVRFMELTDPVSLDDQDASGRYVGASARFEVYFATAEGDPYTAA